MSGVASWTLRCSACEFAQPSDRAAGVCPDCGQPLLARYARYETRAVDGGGAAPRWDLWRYAARLPLLEGEAPVSLGEGLTPTVEVPALL